MMVYSRKREDIAVPLTTDAKIDKTPFIYNPYLKKSDVAKDTKVLVAGEDAQFRITLQNLFDFEIEIERLKLDTKGVEFESVEHGTLEVNGCIVKVTGCRERRFPIFRDAWYGEREFKIQAFGLDASLAPLGQLADKLASEPKNVMIGPKPSYLSFDVVGALPHLILKKTSFSQTAVMLLEGESRVLTFDLYNMSPTSSVDALFFSYEDSTSAEAPTAEVSSFPPSSGGQDDLDSSKGGHYVTDLLQPGQTSRFMLLLPRVLVQNAHAPIPVLDPANRRQFIVDSNKTPPDVERMNRELFWYREEILRLVRGAWRDSETGRSGIIELRNLRLNSRMLDAVRQRVLGITLSLSNSAATAESHAFQVGPSKYEVKTGEFIILRTRVLNRAKQRMQLYLRLQPSLRHQATNVALDISKHFLWNGVLQQPLPALEAMETRELELPICLLHQGEYEITASVEDVGARQSTGKDNRQKKDTEQALEDSVMGIWYADEPCVIIARDEIQGGARHAITPFEE
ncbi:MAG: hypothetical protein M1826_002687 [Phylliscum demangeonii]|nr:MAG: hypothetical protein M1826_002687 [Phylliscum demangeonii]